MKIGIAVSGEAQKQEILDKSIFQHISIQWVYSTRELLQLDTDYWIDCTFSGDEIPYFEKPTLLHAPALTLVSAKPGSKVARFCAWPAFLKRDRWEISIADDDNEWLTEWMELLGQKLMLIKDEPGLIAPRILSTIINEAYYALQAGISSAEEIDIAMKLGTNYPYGPIEWSRKIGLEQVYRLLQTLSEQNPIYTPAFQLS